MPPLRLTSLLDAALPQLSRPSRAVVSTLACLNGHVPPANEVAAWVGLRNRYQLHRILLGDGLPPFEQLAGWARVLYWISRAEETGASLLELARREHVDPAVAYRLVRRVTGKRWSQLRRDGVELIISRLRDDRRPPHSTTREHHQQPAKILPLRRQSPGLAPLHAPDHPTGVLAARLPISDGGLFDVATTAARVALLPRPRAAAVELIELPALKSIGLIHTGPNPTRIVAARSGEVAYVTSQFGEEIDILDLVIGRQSGAISLAGCGHPLGAALAPDEHTLYVTTNADRIYAIALGTRRIRAWMQIPQASQQVGVHPAGHRVYAAGWRKGIITECDATSLRICRTFQLGGCVQDLALTAKGDRMFVANEAGWLDVITFGPDAYNARVNFGSAAFGVALSRDETVVLVSLLLAGRIAVLDAKTLEVRALVQVGGRPRLMAADAAGRGVLVANENGWLDLVM